MLTLNSSLWYISTLLLVLVTQSCLTLHPMDCSPSDSSVHGILQARKLEWVAMPFFRGSSRSRDWPQVSCIAGRFFFFFLPFETPGKPNLTNEGDKNPRPYFRRLEQGLNLLSTMETDKLKPPIFQITLTFFTVTFTSNLWGKSFQLTFCTTVNHIHFPRMQNRKIPKLFNSTECLSKQPD